MENKKLNFVEPEMEVISFSSEDVITTSGLYPAELEEIED